MIRSKTHPSQPHSRRGSLIPVLGVCLLVLGGVMALVLNRVWLANVHQQLQTAAEAAALAAAATLVDDSLLLEDVDSPALMESSRHTAELVAARNLANWAGPAGASSAAVDVRFGRLAVSSLTGHTETLETLDSPDSVLVHAYRDRNHGNPVAMLLPAFTGQSLFDVTATAEASISNFVSAIRPFPQIPAPVWPLAVRERPLEGIPLQSWLVQIEERQGDDQFGWDPESRTVVEEADGLPEIRVITRWNDKPGNLVQVMVSGQDDDTLDRQFRSGWSSSDLEDFDGEFPVADSTIELPSTRDVADSSLAELEALLGQARLLLLYAGDTEDDDAGSVATVRMVGARLMSVVNHDTHLELILQPAVISTRMATLDEEALFRGESSGHPYIFKLSLTQ